MTGDQGQRQLLRAEIDARSHEARRLLERNARILGGVPHRLAMLRASVAEFWLRIGGIAPPRRSRTVRSDR